MTKTNNSKRKGRIVMAVTNDLVTDQRVHRACCALCEAGYTVKLIGRLLPNSLSVERDYPTERMRLLFRRSVLFYAEYNIRLFLKLLFSNADVFYANDTDTLLACRMAAKLRRKRLFFDAHELFPDVPELVGRSAVKRFWESIERGCIPDVEGAVTVSESVAECYRQRYGVDMGVVRNVPDTRYEKKEDVSLPNQNRYILYQGAVNLGRGIDKIIDAMRYLPQYRFIVVGDGDLFEVLSVYAKSVSWGNRIEFLGRLQPEQLLPITKGASLGMVLLDNLGLNYYYSFPNRIGDFVAAHVPMLASDFPEIHKVVDRFQIGTLVDPNITEKALAHTINTTITAWESLPVDERHQRFAAAGQYLDWSTDKAVLIHAVDRLFSTNNTRKMSENKEK